MQNYNSEYLNINQIHFSQVLSDDEEYITVLNFAAIKRRVDSAIADPDQYKFTVSEIAGVLVLSKHTIHTWMRSGYFVPTIRQKQGRGKPMLFSRLDVYKIALFQIEIKLGLSRTESSVIISNINFIKNFIEN